MRYGPNRSIYDTLDEFREEYSQSTDKDNPHVCGMDFIYKGQNYRICREYDEVFYVYKYLVTGYNPQCDILAICNSSEELLDCTVIQGIPFREIVMDDVNTFIYGKDW